MTCDCPDTHKQKIFIVFSGENWGASIMQVNTVFIGLFLTVLSLKTLVVSHIGGLDKKQWQHCCHMTMVSLRAACFVDMNKDCYMS